MGELWLPSRYTPSLTGDENFRTDGDRLLALLDEVWSVAESTSFTWDPWQRWLFRHILERYPDDHPTHPGKLRFRRVVVSVARQNGKTLLEGGLAVYGLTQHVRAPRVIGIASRREQANIAYGYVRHVMTAHRSLRKRFKATGTRGITSRSETNPASYVVYAGTEAALQGPPASLVIFDELHISPAAAWAAVVLGTSARDEAMVVGVTTAGDDNSVLLKELYANGEQAIAGHDERFGFFCWEGIEGAAIDDPESIIAANPAVACGRRSLDDAIADARSIPEAQARRYVHNRFIASENSWLPVSRWAALPTGHVDADRDVVFAVARSEAWEYATITANVKVDGVVRTEVVASLTNPSLERLERLCLQLAPRASVFVMPAETLKPLSDRLRAQGVRTEYLTLAQQANACATAYALISEGRVVHAADPVVSAQLPLAVAVAAGEGWRISMRKSSGDVDAVIATVLGLWGAETIEPEGPALVVA